MCDADPAKREEELIDKARAKHRQLYKKFVEDQLLLQFGDRSAMNTSQVRARYTEKINPFVNHWNQKQTVAKMHKRPNKIQITKKEGEDFCKHKVNQFNLENLKEKLRKAK